MLEHAAIGQVGEYTQFVRHDAHRLDDRIYEPFYLHFFALGFHRQYQVVVSELLPAGHKCLPCR